MEAVLLRHLDVTGAAVIGLPDDEAAGNRDSLSRRVRTLPQL
jgi:hypothetical protein